MDTKKHSVEAGKYLLFVPESFDKAMLTEKNPYGYALNINHPRIATWFSRYKAEKGLPEHYPVSDQEREEFEVRIFNALKLGYELLKKEDDIEKIEKEKQPA